MQQGVNPPGGVATVTKVWSQSSGAFYNAKYNDSARAETHLPESILSAETPSTKGGHADPTKPPLQASQLSG